MANKIRIKRRAVGGAVGAPASLENAELAYNEQDDTLYYGKGSGGVGGSATQVVAIGGPGAFVPAAHVGSGGAAHAEVAPSGPSGFMTGADKAKLDGVAPGATAYAHPANHPASVITQDASNRFVTDAEKAAWNAKGAANGYASLDATGKVPSTQLPSYVDDVLEFANLAAFPGAGETGKIYVAVDTNFTYRWTGSVYVYISSGAYVLPTATASVLGGVKVGAGLTIADGVLASVGGSDAPLLIATNTTAAPGTSYVMTAPLTLTLPANPPVGSVVLFQNASGGACTVARNGQPIMSLAEDLTLDLSYTSAKLAYVNASQGWVLTDMSATQVTQTDWPTITNKPTTVAGYGITDAAGVTNLAQGTRTTTTVPITSSTGTSATLSEATQALAGVLSAADKTKIDNLTSMTFDGGTY